MLIVPMDDANAARGRFVYMMFMFLLFMMFSPNPPNPYRLAIFQSLVAREKHSIDTLRNATWKSPFEVPPTLNLTGVSSLPIRLIKANFTIPEYVTQTVDSLSPKPLEETAFYSNITSVLRGKWHRIPEPNSNPFLPPDTPDENQHSFQKVFPAPSEWGNTTYRDTILGHSGKFSLELSERHSNDTIQFVEVPPLRSC
jgi:hypothetical protein